MQGQNGRTGGEPDFDLNAFHVVDREGEPCRDVRTPLDRAEGRGDRDPRRGPTGGLAAAGFPDRGVPADSEPVRSLPDVPLIVEDLLLQARELAVFGAPTEAVKAILDHVAALREGRG